MTLISGTALIRRGWLKSYWDKRDRARDLARQYQAMREECPLVLADLARFCCAFDSTFDENRDVTLLNTGKREAWLHIEAMQGLEPADLEHLREETERE